jgi:hypothetical protein
MADPINLWNIDRMFDKIMSIEVRDKQVGGDHYKKTSIEPWDVFLDWQLDPWLCNVLKYCQRHHRKNGKQDLEKAKHYLEFVLTNYDLVVDKYYKK